MGPGRQLSAWECRDQQCSNPQHPHQKLGMAAAVLSRDRGLTGQTARLKWLAFHSVGDPVSGQSGREGQKKTPEILLRCLHTGTWHSHAHSHVCTHTQDRKPSDYKLKQFLSFIIRLCMASKNGDKEHREPRVRKSREPPSLLPFFSSPQSD